MDNLIVLAVAIGVAGIPFGYYLDKRAWNKGVCKKNGIDWEYFDTDSQGGRGYKAGDQYIFVSYRVDKHR